MTKFRWALYFVQPPSCWSWLCSLSKTESRFTTTSSTNQTPGRAGLCKTVSVVVLSATCKRNGDANGRQNQNRDHPDRGGRVFAGILAVRKRAVFEGLETGQEP